MQAACRAANGKVPLCMVHVKQEPQHLVLSAFRGVPIWEMAQFRCGELRRPLHYWRGAHEFCLLRSLEVRLSLKTKATSRRTPPQGAKMVQSLCRSVQNQEKKARSFRLSDLRSKLGIGADLFPSVPSRTAARSGLDHSRATARASILETPLSPARDCGCLCQN